MSIIEAPTIREPDHPAHLYYMNNIMRQTTHSKVSTANPPTPLVPIIKDLKYIVKVEEFIAECNSFRKKTKAWQKNQAKCYYLILSHCPTELEQKLRNTTQWAETKADQDMIAFLKMIQDVTHNMKEQKENVTSVVET